MNIFEFYIKKYNKFIILILGIQCSNKSQIAKELCIDLKLPLININDYIIKNKFIEKKIEDVTFKLYDHENAFDWDKLNNDVKQTQDNGVIIYGNYIAIDKINWTPDFSFFIDMNKLLCKDILLEKQMINPNYSQEKIDIYLKNILFPLFDNLLKNLKVDKFFKIKEDTTFQEFYDTFFNTLMEFIEKKIPK